MRLIDEIYRKYEHLDDLLSDREWLADNFEGAILLDLWQAVKSETEMARPCSPGEGQGPQGQGDTMSKYIPEEKKFYRLTECGLSSEKQGTNEAATCDVCGTKLVDKCVHCGAPQCCPLCCAQARLDDQKKEIEKLKQERDLAIAHDRQPYPTADAYEKVCAILHKKEAENAKLKEDIESGCHEHTVGTSVDEDGCCISCGEDLNLIATQAERIEKLKNESLKPCVTCDVFQENDRLKERIEKLCVENGILWEKNKAQVERIKRLEGFIKFIEIELEDVSDVRIAKRFCKQALKGK